MTQQPDPTTQNTDIGPADLDADIEIPPDAVPATSDPDSYVDDGLGLGDGPDIQAATNSGS